MSGTAQIYPEAVLTPSKQDLLRAWLGSQPWFAGDASEAVIVGAYRFVDPDGEVGIESQLVRANGVTYHVPLTYRDAPLEDADGELVGTMDHSVLGTRYVYDAHVDPVYVAELVRVIREGDTEAERSALPKTAWCVGSGVVPGVDVTGQVRLIRVMDDAHDDAPQARGVLTGRWLEDGVEREHLLAVLR